MVNGRPLMKLSVVHFPHFFLSSLQNSLYMLLLELRSAVESWLFLKLILTNVSTKLFKPCHITLHPWDFFPPLLGVFFYKHWFWTQIYNMFPDVFPVHEKTSSVPMISHTHTHTLYFSVNDSISLIRIYSLKTVGYLIILLCPLPNRRRNMQFMNICYDLKKLILLSTAHKEYNVCLWE